MIGNLMWLVTALSIIGTIGNVHKKRWGFGVWSITNFAWVLYNIHLGAHAQATLFAVYFGLAIWGFIKWSKKCG